MKKTPPLAPQTVTQVTHAFWPALQRARDGEGRVQGRLTLRHRLTVNAHVDDVTQLAFAGQYLIAGGSEGAVALWKLSLQKDAAKSLSLV